MKAHLSWERVVEDKERGKNRQRGGSGWLHKGHLFQSTCLLPKQQVGTESRALECLRETHWWKWRRHARSTWCESDLKRQHLCLKKRLISPLNLSNSHFLVKQVGYYSCKLCEGSGKKVDKGCLSHYSRTAELKVKWKGVHHEMQMLF